MDVLLLKMAQDFPPHLPPFGTLEPPLLLGLLSFGKALLEVCTHKLTRTHMEHSHLNFKAEGYGLLPRPLDPLLGFITVRRVQCSASPFLASSS